MKLAGIELRRVQMPLVAPFRTSFGVEHLRDILLLRAVLDGPDGQSEGWGECAPGSSSRERTHARAPERPRASGTD